MIKNNDHYLMKLNGDHTHKDGLKKEKFYRIYQFLAKEKWKHIQIFNDKDIVIVVRLC